ncbi:hypothetical protein Tco_0117258 [Tanacetum coccineum]
MKIINSITMQADSSKSPPSSPPFAEINDPKDNKSNATASTVSGGSTTGSSATRFTEISPLLTLKDDKPPKIHQPSTSQENNNDHNDTASRRTITAWRKMHEIDILKAIIEYHNVTGTYPFVDQGHMQKFMKIRLNGHGARQVIASSGENVLASMDSYDVERRQNGWAGGHMHWEKWALG